MSENIVDFLWQTYWITGDADIPDMLANLADAVDQYGFTTQYSGGSYVTRSGYTTPNGNGTPPYTQSCNTEGADTDLLYFGSAYASDSARNHPDWWRSYTDNHNIETVLTLAAGYYFETDAATKTRLQSRTNKLVNGWSNATCATIFSNIYRLFNWQHRSNSVRTWDWVEEQ